MIPLCDIIPTSMCSLFVWSCEFVIYEVSIISFLSIGSDASANILEAEHVESTDMVGYIPVLENQKEEKALSIIVVGASGDLARKKIFPALFSLFCDDRLPKVWLSIYIYTFLHSKYFLESVL